jgi:hypothetical protein
MQGLRSEANQENVRRIEMGGTIGVESVNRERGEMNRVGYE